MLNQRANLMIFCSTIIPTIGRSTLSRAVMSVLEQQHPSFDLELIIVNDSGKPLLSASGPYSEKVQIINTCQRERSVARNTGAAMAKGKYLHFLDDDDWLEPGAYRHFWELSQSNDAKWLYGMTQLRDRRNEPTIRLRHNLHGNCFVQAMAGEWIPLQASLIERNAFMRIGGFNPQLAGPEDIDLLRRIQLEEEIAETPNLIANVIMGEDGSTTDYARHPQASRWARENILDAPNVYSRMCLSAVNPFWKGRIVRIYLTSIIWNLQHKRLFTAISRVLYLVAILMRSLTEMFSLDFWKSVLKPYASMTFEKGMQESQRAT
jgi:glycosyltransferase involved in cell wall biosynthesis